MCVCAQKEKRTGVFKDSKSTFSWLKCTKSLLITADASKTVKSRFTPNTGVFLKDKKKEREPYKIPLVNNTVVIYGDDIRRAFEGRRAVTSESQRDTRPRNYSIGMWIHFNEG